MGSSNYSERVRSTYFCCVFKLGFQLISNAYLIFKLILELISKRLQIIKNLDLVSKIFFIFQ